MIELASFAAFSPTHQSLLDQLTESIGLVLNTVGAPSVTERLLEPSQSQAQELQSRQEQLRQSNEDLAEQASLLAGKERRGGEQVPGGGGGEATRRAEGQGARGVVEVQVGVHREHVPRAAHAAQQPAGAGRQLEENPEGNLTERQVQYAGVIHSSGVDLLKLLNDILDLAKVESKTVTFEMSELFLADLRDNMVHTFHPIAEQQGLAFAVEIDDRLPATILTDPHRLRQVLKNLLSTGLGLSISRNLVELLGAERQGVLLRRAAAGTTVLIVDDHFPNIFAMTALLERGRMNVVAAQSGQAALELLDQRSDIDIILMDIIMMPVMNGYETIIEIRKRPECADTPIIAVTGKVVGSERERCLAAGASDYIPKPVDATELMAALSTWFPAVPRAELSS